MDALILTLGHGSSAIYVKDNKIVNGYMNERITKIKSDSQFPFAAIEELLKWDKISDIIDIYVSHWEPTANIGNMSKRHWNEGYIKRKFPKCKIISLNINFTHHKAHAYSALAYFKNIPNGDHIVVADGFGNYGEVLSVYEMINGKPECIHSCHNYDASLGLLYQYATDYVGLKMNQDEWKLNAAASDIDEENMPILNDISKQLSQVYIDRLNIPRESCGDPMIELGALSYVHKNVIDLLSKYFSPDEKANIAYVLQNIVQDCIINIIQKYDIKNIYCAGGVFMNVQLNGYLAIMIPGTIGVMPLSGDNGAGLGLYKYYNPEFVIPDDFCWGKRDLSIIVHDNIIFTADLEGLLSDLLHANFIVNVVRGKMEFGERAYCNTSTIAKPTKANAILINKANGRDSCMPMAPVVNKVLYHTLFNKQVKVVKSVEHMIMSLPYKDKKKWANTGISHHVVSNNTYTGRPQVIDNHYMNQICYKFGPLINTSFNIHGQPICLTMKDIIKAHEYQQKHDTNGNFVTIIEVGNNE